jgi:CheY-like chemotaxis protein
MQRNLPVLIAEDNEDDAFLLRRALRTTGVEGPVQIVTDGEQVISYLRGEGSFADRQQFPFPGVLFLDIKMPRLGGFGVLEWVHKHPECHVIPTMMFSSSAHPDDVKRAYQSGANAYLVKPATITDLEAVLKKVWDFWLVCARPPLPERCA